MPAKKKSIAKQSTGRKRGPGTRLPDADAELRILDAARRVFIRRGTAGARMQEIAEEAGVNQALLHYYYRSKDRLAERVFLEAAARLFGALAPAVSADAPLEVIIERFVQRYIDEVRKSPFIPGYVVAELHHHPERVPELLARVTGSSAAAVGKAALEGFRAKLAEQVAAGTMRPVDPQQFLVSLAGMVVFPFVARPMLGAVLELSGSEFDRFLDQRRAELPGFILNALRP
jgi:TetR/AcrR family transcriptional regulator